LWCHDPVVKLNIQFAALMKQNANQPCFDLTHLLYYAALPAMSITTDVANPTSMWPAAAAAAVIITSPSERNFLGLNQKLSALVELGQADSLFRLQWVDPWIHGDPNRTSRTLSIMNTR
jgi:hypothetical protein